MPRPYEFCPRCAKPLSTRKEGELERRVCADAACGFVHYDNPLPVVASLVEHDGDVLLVRNKGWPETWYGLVSGFLEKGEAPDAAALRELQEELGLSGEIVSLIGVYGFPERNEVILAYHVRATGTVALGEELADYKRVPPEKLRPWPMGTGHAVKDWLARRNAKT